MRPEANLESIIWSEQHYFDYTDVILESQKDLKEKYTKLVSHLDIVKNNCRTLAFALIDEGKFELAHSLMVAGQTHDLSKFYGNEWEYLCDYEKHKGDPELSVAIRDHVENNFHHPEAWSHKNGIHSMGDAELAELVCDWVARGQEFGKGVRRFMEESAFSKYDFNKESLVFDKISYFYKLLTGAELWNVQK